MIYSNNLKYCLFCFIRFIRLITQRSEARILSPLPITTRGYGWNRDPFFLPKKSISNPISNLQGIGLENQDLLDFILSIYESLFIFT